mmetsp:Transcript_772/g.1322  ORF Transcript_772/g.1322 Transcript_772/m.1322 type:complete len:204 (+) Transcript_772:300-911(+)|eukprot:CAMPEP_0201616370 /NCGR_PEP_ID=MMETSP0492-20130828/33699_1 /ASSEMBLY_ACC=CAM_ASM_000837 /TAXON_ID=420259 /ORGANISM="Thalassiosira gravida, Strain GMp14c1" /LENGTH=203 /DNA_ID=CAMNT_0048084305 /DNA_START=22 /DNA_END=633 /DNA_ORIENTATION=-
MTSQPTESQNTSNEASKTPATSAAAKDQKGSADAASDNSSVAAHTTPLKDTRKEDADGTTKDTKSNSNATTTTNNENTAAANPPKETSITKATSTTKNPKLLKIKVHLVAVGSAPILKKSKFLMNADDRFAVAIAFLRKVLKLSTSGTSSSATGASAMASSSLFLYVNAAFVPSPDERIGDLFDCFGVRGELVVHYSLQEAWG